MEDPKNERIKIRETLCPSMGRLYPMYYYQLKNVETLDEMRDIIKGFIDYWVLLMDVPEPNKINENYSKTLEDFMYEEEVKKLSDSFDL